MAYFSQDPVYTTIAIIAELGEIKPYFSCNEEHKVYFPSSFSPLWNGEHVVVFWKVLFIQRLQLAELEEIKQRKERLKYLQLHQIDFKMCCGRTIF